MHRDPRGERDLDVVITDWTEAMYACGAVGHDDVLHGNTLLRGFLMRSRLDADIAFRVLDEPSSSELDRGYTKEWMNSRRVPARGTQRAHHAVDVSAAGRHRSATGTRVFAAPTRAARDVTEEATASAALARHR